MNGLVVIPILLAIAALIALGVTAGDAEVDERLRRRAVDRAERRARAEWQARNEALASTFPRVFKS